MKHNKYILVDCKLDVIKFLRIFTFGLVALSLASYLILMGKSSWWIVLFLLGLFIVYNWGKILVKGKVSVGVIVIDHKLNIVFDFKRTIQKKISDFESGNFYTKTYNLNDISHLWRYSQSIQTTLVNKTTYSDNIKVLNNSKKEEVIDLSDLSVKLSHENYHSITAYLKQYHPTLALEEPEEVLIEQKTETLTEEEEEEEEKNGGRLFLFTSYKNKEVIYNALEGFSYTENENEIKVESLGVTITDGDDYFLKQKPGMLNFYQMFASGEVHSKFFTHLESCEKAYNIHYTDQALVNAFFNKLIEESAGLIFSPDMTFYSKDWKVIIDSAGNCDLTPEEYSVSMSSKTFDEKLPESTEESSTRKKQTLTKLEAIGVPFTEHLPTIPDSTQVQLRDKTTLAKRVIALAAVAKVGDTGDTEPSVQLLKKFGFLTNDVSPAEYDFLSAKNLEEEVRNKFTWRYESLNVLLWSGGYIDTLQFPSDMVDVSSITEPFKAENFEQFLTHSTLRPTNEILDELDLNYRLHWACRDALHKKIDFPTGVHPAVVFERHYALNWLINLCDEEWDHISTHT